MKLMRLIGKDQTLILIISVLLMSASTQSALPTAIVDSRQLIIVTTTNWDAVDGELQRYERANHNQPWRAVGGKIPIVVGRNGMAWGKGLHGDAIGDGPVKKEGDGKSPAGLFSLSSAFGYEKKRLKLPYQQATSTLECVDDTRSVHYNKVLDRQSVEKPDWKSSEQMLRNDDLYRLGVIVGHNATRTPECGSCIFLHIWAGRGKGTAGCTAMESGAMEVVLGWLDAKKKPVLAQAPDDELQRLAGEWNLPERKRNKRK
jgi:D-alanyl-D-alanine dipeptidase